MSTPNPFLTAAAPAIITALQAVQTFFANLGTDPAQVAVKLPGAAQVLLGTLEMELPGLAASELGAVQSAVNAKIAELINKTQASLGNAQGSGAVISGGGPSGGSAGGSASASTPAVIKA